MVGARCFRPRLLWVLCMVGCEVRQPSEPALEPASAAGPKVIAPSNLSTFAVSPNQIDVSWRDNSSNETGFELHRSIAGAAFGVLASTEAGVTSYGDAGLAASTQYCYQVRSFRAYDGKTSYSAFSAAACATTPAPPPPPPPPLPPAAPTLRAADTHPSAIMLWWFGHSDQDGFKIERCVGIICGDAEFAVIAVFATTSIGDHFLPDYEVVPGTTYTYRVRAFNSAGDSAPSNPVSATACFVEIWDGFYVCSQPSPSAPGSVDAKPENSSAVTIGWTDNSTNEDGFRVERSLDGGSSWTSARTTGPNAILSTDDGRTTEQQVCYRVIAYNAQGDSPPSNTHCTTPPAAPSHLVATTTGMMGEINVLGWTDNSGVEDGYEVQRFDCTYDLECRFWTHTILGANATSFSEEVLWGNTYIYRVLAIKDGGRSDPSNEATVYGQ